MAEKSYTMDDLSLVKTEETVPLKRRSSQGDQPSRNNVSVKVFFMILHECNFWKLAVTDFFFNLLLNLPF